MYLVITRTFPPELGGMQNLMWGLARSLSKLNLIKVFADYHENHEEFDKSVSFSIERVSGMKLIRKYRKSSESKIWQNWCVINKFRYSGLY